MKIQRSKSLEIPKNKGVIENTPGINIQLRTNKTLTVKDAKRILSMVIKKFISGENIGSESKTLAYLLTCYIQIIKDTETESRLKALETQIRKNVI